MLNHAAGFAVILVGQAADGVAVARDDGVVLGGVHFRRPLNQLAIDARLFEQLGDGVMAFASVVFGGLLFGVAARGCFAGAVVVVVDFKKQCFCVAVHGAAVADVGERLAVDSAWVGLADVLRQWDDGDDVFELVVDVGDGVDGGVEEAVGRDGGVDAHVASQLVQVDDRPKVAAVDVLFVDGLCVCWGGGIKVESGHFRRPFLLGYGRGGGAGWKGLGLQTGRRLPYGGGAFIFRAVFSGRRCVF